MSGQKQNYKGKRMLKRTERSDISWAYGNSKLSTNKNLLLLDNVQFIYELSLAQFELSAFEVQFKLTNGLREFKLCNIKNVEEIRRRLAYFKYVQCEPTDYFQIIQKNRTRSVNQYLTHWIYPYKGKFHPQMIRALLNIIGLKQGDVVFEPFSGSGTTALEAQLLGINFVGIDMSPLCIIQGRVKTESIYVLEDILKIRDKVTTKLAPNLFSSKMDYYKLIDNLTHDDRVNNFYKLVRLVAISDASRRRRDYEQSFVSNFEKMIASIKDYTEIKNKLNLILGSVDIKVGDARKINLPDNSVDGIITSPPYSIALDYIKNDEHSLHDLGYDSFTMRDDFIGLRGARRNRVELYNEDMKKAYSEMYRILKPKKYAVIVIGNATFNSEEVNTVRFTIDSMMSIGFKFTKNINKIIFGLYNVMKKENILIFKKEQ
jgi:DNA modification methylase